MQQYADLVFINGRINTQDANRPWAECMAIGQGRILSTDATAISNLIDDQTTTVDLQGKFVMPGLIDCHIHALWGARQDLFECFVGYDADLHLLKQKLSAWVANTDADQWITGGPWNLAHVDAIKATGKSPRQWLDEISLQHPICLYDTTKHSMLANSRALELGQIKDQIDTYNPALIGLDEHGELDGLLHEEASAPVRQFIHYSAAQLLEAGHYLVDTLHAYGVTSIKEAMAFAAELTTYQQLDHDGRLNLNVFSHIARSSPLGTSSLSIPQMLTLRDTYTSTNHQPNGCKLFLDGVAPSRTAAFFEPYVPCCCVSEAADKYDADALLRIPPDELAQQMQELDEAGFTIKMHAVGDRAVNAGLNGIAATKTSGDRGIRHEIAHTSFVAEGDFERFAKLNAVAEVSPKIWFPTAVTAAQHKVLGVERTNRCHPIKKLLQHGALVTYGSDWPAAVPDADPWIGMAGMITREHPHGLYEGHVGKDQAISLDDALAIFTKYGAQALRLDDQVGQLKAGFQANFIILNQHLDQIAANDIANTQVLATYFAGECVYNHKKAGL